MHYNQKPIIGIVAKPLLPNQSLSINKEGMIQSSLWNRIIINDECRQLITDHGGIATGILPKRFFGNPDTIIDIKEELNDSDKEVLFSQLKNVDGILLQGGLTADTYEIEVVNYAIKNNIPIIGICAGFNNIARALQLSLSMDEKMNKLHNVYDKDYRHSVFINKNSSLHFLFESNEIQVNSLHTLFLNEKAANEKIEILAEDKNKYIEAFCVKNTKLCIAIKWHPELMLNDRTTQNIFQYFITQCKNN